MLNAPVRPNFQKKRWRKNRTFCGELITRNKTTEALNCCETKTPRPTRMISLIQIYNKCDPRQVGDSAKTVKSDGPWREFTVIFYRNNLTFRTLLKSLSREISTVCRRREYRYRRRAPMFPYYTSVVF